MVVEIPKMMSLPEAVAILKAAGCSVSAQFLRRRIASGELKAKKVGRSWVISEDNLRAFVGDTSAQIDSGGKPPKGR